MYKLVCNTLALALIVSTTTSFAAVKEGAFSVTPVIGGYRYDGSQRLDSSLLLGVRAGYNITKSIGVEALYDYAADTDAPSVALKNISLQRYGGQALYHFFPDNVLVPYLAAGYSRLSFSGSGVNSKSHGEFDYGAGIKYFLANNIALRGDVRHILYTYDSRNFNNAEVTFGVQYQFGGSAPAGKTVAATGEQNHPKERPDKAACPPLPEPTASAPAPIPAPVASPPVACLPVACAPVTCTPSPEVVKTVFTPVTKEACEPLWKDEQTRAALAVTAKVCELPADSTILYGSDRVLFQVDYQDELDKVGRFLQEFPTAHVTIAGHTDADGSKEDNLQLSLVRAAVARSHIVYKFRIDRSRISIKGYGASKPAASTKTEAGKARNRRVEVVFSCD